MKTNSVALLFPVVVLALGISSAALGQPAVTDPTAAANTNAPAATNIPPASPSRAETKSLFGELASVRGQADTLNEVFNRLQKTNSPLAWLKALNLHFKIFEPSAPDMEAGLGVEYDYDKAVTDAKLFGEKNPAYLTFNLKARGNVSFDKENNPANFLQSGAQVHLWQFFGQTDEDPADESGLTLSSRVFRELAQDKYRGKSGNELRELPVWKDFAAHAFDKDPNEFFYDLAGNFALESNQTFSKKQYAYGLQFQPRFRSWKPDSAWSRFNFFDWPFALTRMLGGEPWQPRGRFLPGVMVGIDLIDPVGNSDRFNVDPDEDPYARFKAEIGFRSKVLEWEGKSIWFNAGYRYFQELDASGAIRVADMDKQDYFAASLDLPWNFSITYSTGKLPFDLRNQQVWALGYRVRF
jgi:TolA-binding protein